MTNTQPSLESVRVGSHIQTEDGVIHHVLKINIRRTPKRQILREAKIFSGATRTWVDLLAFDWRIIGKAIGVIPGSRNSVDGLDHSYSCTGSRTITQSLKEGFTKTCLKCGFSVYGHQSREDAEFAYISDAFGRPSQP